MGRKITEICREVLGNEEACMEAYEELLLGLAGIPYNNDLDLKWLLIKYNGDSINPTYMFLLISEYLNRGNIEAARPIYERFKALYGEIEWDELEFGGYTNDKAKFLIK